MTSEQNNNGSGYLQVGHNRHGEAVINLPRDVTWHIVFSPRQARQLAAVLVEIAIRIEQETPHAPD